MRCRSFRRTDVGIASCANLLKLPGYNVGPDVSVYCPADAPPRIVQDEYTLRSKLLQAITSGAGFDLS